MNRKPFTVAQVNRYIKSLLEDDALLAEICVEGEVSNFKHHSSGHMYFTLKDAQAAVNCVMFRGRQTAGPFFLPENGMKIILFGYVSLYEKTGQYQLYAERMEPSGVGGLQAAFEQMRDRLQKEGLFDTSRKKSIPAFVKCAALITSPTGAAVRDMIRIIKNRNSTVKIVVAPALVQGENAAPDITRAIAEVNAWAGADVIILGRGGGSMEDLWAFNEEIVARAIAVSNIPVISAVGHETDFTIADFAADLRAPTPTAAAASAVFDCQETRTRVAVLAKRAGKAVQNACEANRKMLLALIKSRCLQRPLEPIYQRQMYVQDLYRDAHRGMVSILQNKKTELENRAALLEKVSPHNLWKRGFAIVRSDSSEPIYSVHDLQIDQRISIQFSDGCADALVVRKQVT